MQGRLNGRRNIYFGDIVCRHHAFPRCEAITLLALYALRKTGEGFACGRQTRVGRDNGRRCGRGKGRRGNADVAAVCHSQTTTPIGRR